jgi:branched-chain amino acid transport system substrate-binding protein
VLRKFWVCSAVFCFLGLIFAADTRAEDKIKIGVATALTGDAAAFGVDIRNAITLMNEKFGGGKYAVIFEDEQCENRVAVSVANKLINIDKVHYVLGFPCNQSMLATASIYDRANILVITSSATSGDVLDIGKHVFRLFPSDVGGAKLLYDYMAKRHKQIAVLTEQTEYPVMMERTVTRENDNSTTPIEVVTEQFRHGETDLRTIVFKLINRGVEGIFINANTDTSFISVVKQVRAVKFPGALYAVYLPGSAVVLKELRSEVDGFIYSNLPLADDLMTAKGKELLQEFRRRFGEPQSGFPVVPTTFEAFRVLDLAVQSGTDPVAYLSKNKFSGGFLPDFYFDEHGAVQGINFEMQKIVDGKVVVIKEH